MPESLFSSPPTAAPASFTGWLRPAGAPRWRRACEAATEAGCWRELLQHQLPAGGDRAVTAGDQYPTKGARP